MTLAKFASFFVLTLLFQGFAQAQEWTSHQSPNGINDLLDTGTELLLATDAGLVVVDKSTLERQTFNTGNSSLTNNHIQTIAQGQNGSIWIGTYDVIMFQFDGSDFQAQDRPDHEAIRNFTKLYDLKVAPNGDLWTATQHGVFHREGQTWSHYGEVEFGPAFFESWDLEIKDNGDVLVVGREVHQLVGGEWVNLSEGTEFQGYLDAEIFTSSAGDLFVAGDLDRIFRFDGQDWEGYPLDFNGSQLLGFTEDTEGNIYYYTSRDGVFKLENNSWVQLADDQTAGFSEVTASIFYIDEQNNRWLNRNIHLSVNEGGEIRSTLLADHMLESNNVEEVTKGDNGKMYFSAGQQSNFSVLDTEDNWSALPKPEIDYPNEFYTDMIVFGDDDILVSSTLGLYRYDGNNWTFTSLMNARNLVRDSQGKLYVFSDNKIYILNDGVLSEYNTTNSELSNIQLSGYGVDANDNLWIATYSFDEANVIQTVTPEGNWTTYTTADHPAIARPRGNFAFDNNGDVWIINEPFGALKFDGTAWTDPIRETANGVLTNKGVSAVKSDTEGKLYFAHEYGISTFLNGEWENFVNEDVITNNSAGTTIEFDDAGTLWWANGRTGLFSFEPAVISSSSSPFNAVAAMNFTLYPNPAQAYTTIDFTTKESAKVTVAIYNQLGQLTSYIDLGQLPEGTYQQEINVDHLPTGFYTVQLQVNNSSATAKFVVQ